MILKLGTLERKNLAVPFGLGALAGASATALLLKKKPTVLSDVLSQLKGAKKLSKLEYKIFKRFKK